MPLVRRAGYLAVSAAAVLWAVGGAYASRLIDRGASFVEVTEARAWITVLVLLVVVSRSKERDDLGPQPAWWVTVLFGLSIAGANFMYYLSLSRLPVAVAITIQYMAPALVVLSEVVVRGFRPSRRMVGSLVAALIGVALLAELPSLIASGTLRLDGLGLVASVLAGISFATYIVTGEYVANGYGAQRSVLRGFIVASVLWIVVQAARGRPDTLLDRRFIPGVLFLAFATTIAPFLLFIWGLGRIRSSEAGIIATLEPLTAAVIAYVWLHQSLSGWQIAGGALVIVGIALIQVDRPASPDVLTERAAVE